MENTISETDISVSITYQSNRVVYAPGDAVIGSVVLKLKKPKKVEEIKVSAIGESAIKLKTPEGKQLRNNEKYFRYTFNVSTGGDSELTTGNHDFSFLITLPMVLPSSYEGEFGYVRYCIHADVKFEDVFAGDPNITSIFTVLDVVDLNTRCSSRMIQRIYCAKAASRILGRRENAVIVDLTTEKSGYVPGEFMYLNGRIVNGR